VHGQLRGSPANARRTTRPATIVSVDATFSMGTNGDDLGERAAAGGAGEPSPAVSEARERYSSKRPAASSSGPEANAATSEEGCGIGSRVTVPSPAQTRFT